MEQPKSPGLSSKRAVLDAGGGPATGSDLDLHPAAAVAAETRWLEGEEAFTRGVVTVGKRLAALAAVRRVDSLRDVMRIAGHSRRIV